MFLSINPLHSHSLGEQGVKVVCECKGLTQVFCMWHARSGICVYVRMSVDYTQVLCVTVLYMWHATSGIAFTSGVGEGAVEGCICRGLWISF